MSVGGFLQGFDRRPPKAHSVVAEPDVDLVTFCNVQARRVRTPKERAIRIGPQEALALDRHT